MAVSVGAADMLNGFAQAPYAKPLGVPLLKTVSLALKGALVPS